VSEQVPLMGTVSVRNKTVQCAINRTCNENFTCDYTL